MTLPIRNIAPPLLWLACVVFGGGCVHHPKHDDTLDAVSLVKLGTVGIDPERKIMVVSGFVNQVEGALELLACGPGGKTHESAFVLFANATDIQAGLLLLGLQPGIPMSGIGVGPPAGDPVRIEIHWKEGERMRRGFAEDFLLDVKTRGKARHEAWIFNGSKIENNYFLALAEESFIATYWDPWAIINLKSDLGADDERLAIHREKIPPLHTPILMTIRPDRP